MTYEKICEYIDRIPMFTKKNGLGHTKELLERLDIREHRFKIIHVAGSNGKGSVCAFMNQVLHEAGCQVGMFTSPHLVCMEERFVINGTQCSREEFAESFEAVRQAVQSMEEDGLAHPAFFEFLFAMGMYLFQKRKVEYLILETGLGGRLDATNVFEEPLLTIITSISLEHTAILGDTIEQIAGEKAGIIKEGIPVVFDASNETAAAVIMRKAREKHAPFYRISLENIKFQEITGKNIDFCYMTGYDIVNLRIPFAAKYQMMNAALAYKAMEILKTETGIERPFIRKGMEHTRWQGRMQEAAPGIYFDGAHNADGIAGFVETVAAIGASRPLLLFSMVRDKDYAEVVKELCKSVSWESVIVTRIPDERGLEPDILKREFQKYGQQTVCIEDCGMAYQYACGQKKEKQALFCAGSLYLIGELEKVQGGAEHD